MAARHTTQALYDTTVRLVPTDVPHKRLAAAVIQSAIIDHDLAFLESDEALIWCGLVTPEGRSAADVRAKALELARRKRRLL